MKIHEKWVDYTDGRSTRPMTPQEIRRLSPEVLELLFFNQQADEVPFGSFDGEAWSDDLSFIETLSAKIWQGKVFIEESWGYVTVRNKILGKLLFSGYVTLTDGSVWIDYPQLGLRDELKPVQAGLWLGRMLLGPSVIWFTLEKET